MNLVSAVADAWQEIRRFFLNDLVTLVREQQTVLMVKGQNQNPKRLRFSFLQFNMQDLQKFIEDWDVIRGKGGGHFEKEHANKKPKDEKKESPNPQRISRTRIRHTFGVRLPASSCGLSARLHPFILPVRPLTNHGLAVQMTSIDHFLSLIARSLRDRDGRCQSYPKLPSLQKGRGGHVPTLRIWGRLETKSIWNTYEIDPEEQRLEPTMSQRFRVIPHANTNLVSCSHRFIFMARDGI